MRVSKWMKPLVGGLVAFAAACGPTESENFCLTDSECNAGETCDVVNNTCGCTVAAGETADSCTTADATKVCSPATTRCIAKCSETSCGEGKVCNATTFLCEDDGSTDCTQPGNECASTDACNPFTKACETKCSGESCGAGKVCHPTQFFCQDTCIGAAANFCGEGKVCDATGLCVDACGEGTCLETEYCAEDGYCDTRCDAEGGALCQESEYCSATTGQCTLKCNETGAPACTNGTVCAGNGLCVESCVSTGCTNAHCNPANGLCETFLDISECYDDTTPTELLYVDEATNMCVAAEDSDLDSCEAASGRDSSKPVSPNGPVLYNARQVEIMSAQELIDAGNCTYGVWVLFDYYDPSGEMWTTSGGAARTYFVAAGSNNDASPALPVKYCVSGGDSKCLGVQGSTATQGSFAAAFCRPQAGTDEIAIYVRDNNAGNTHFGNTICVEVNTAP